MYNFQFLFIEVKRRDWMEMSADEEVSWGGLEIILIFINIHANGEGGAEKMAISVIRKCENKYYKWHEIHHRRRSECFV